jgi:hypothetical protein
MPACVRIGDDDTDGDSCTSGSSNVFTNNIPQVRVTDGDTDGDTKTSGSPNVFVNNLAVHRIGDGDTDGDTTVSGSPNVFANDGGGVSGTTIIQGRVVYENTPQGIAALVAEETSVSPSLPKYHEDTPGGTTPATVVTATNSSGTVITISAPPITAPSASEQREPGRPPAPPEGCKNSKYYIIADAKMTMQDQVGLTKDQIECNWIALCTNILDRLRDDGFTFIINSGFRTIEYNRSIGSSDSSDHTSGCAADISSGSQEANKTLFKAILNKYPYSQLIFEGNWVHVAYNGKSPKGGAKVMYTYTGSSPKAAGGFGEYLPGDLRAA